jgi:hypothetical protein
MRQYLFPSLILSIGLICSQVLFSTVVYISNYLLFEHLTAIYQAGYLVVPNLQVMETLKEFTPAICGALFFTLTTGAGLTVLSFVLILLWRALNFQKSILCVILILWAALIYKINSNGLNITATAACLIIPIIISFMSIRLFPKSIRPFYGIQIAMHGIILLFIFLACTPVLNKDAFISFRDYLLLGNSIGQKINNFYYTYTMYPAEVFKPLDQRLLKTCHIQINNREQFVILERKLRQLDYLEVGQANPVDVTIKEADYQLKFFHDGKMILESTPATFVADPEKTMSEFSQKCDHNSFFRKITFMSLVIGLPILTYMLLHAAIMLMLFFLPWNRIKSLLSGILCLLLSVVLTLPLYRNRTGSLPESEIIHFLSSNNWRDRTAALKKISDENIEIDQYKGNFNDTDFQRIPEKYWFAKALSTSKSENTYNLLLSYLNDPNPNVVCMALYSLGKRDQTNAIGMIVSMIKSEKNWYIQWYAYKALKRMGWTQSRSIHFQ